MMWWLSSEKIFLKGGSEEGNWWLSSEIIFNIHIRVMKQSFFDGDPNNKLHLCMDFSSRPGEQVDDPWYTGDFSGVYAQIEEGCMGLLKIIKKEM